MDYRQVMDQLATWGTDQNRKVYTRHGAKGDMFGVSFGNLRSLAKKLGRNHELAIELWNSGNTDARILACSVFEPEKLSEQDILSHLDKIDYYVLLDEYVYGTLYMSHLSEGMMEMLMNDEREFFGRAGYALATKKALSKNESEQFYEDILEKIENNLQTSPNRKKEGMNSTLISIGLVSDSLYEKAKAAAKRIGKVEIDHGDTACRTFDAIEYMDKARNR